MFSPQRLLSIFHMQSYSSRPIIGTSLEATSLLLHSEKTYMNQLQTMQYSVYNVNCLYLTPLLRCRSNLRYALYLSRSVHQSGVSGLMLHELPIWPDHSSEWSGQMGPCDMRCFSWRACWTFWKSQIPECFCNF